MARTVADLRVGDTLPTIRREVTPERVARDAEFKGDDNRWYTGPSPWGGPVAPVTLTNADFNEFLRRNDFEMSRLIPVGVAHEYFGPILVGSTIETTCTVVDRSERRGRQYVTFEFVTRGEAGKVLVRQRDTILRMPPPQEPPA
jgi:acyl dehydratase